LTDIINLIKQCGKYPDEYKNIGNCIDMLGNLV